jgi:phosphonate transport system substrate-binding protein
MIFNVDTYKRIVLLLFFFIILGFNDNIKAQTQPQKEKSILIGILPERNIFKQMERFEPLAQYLSKRIGINVKIAILPRYENIVNNFISGRFDGAFFGSFTYAYAHSRLNLEVLARPERFDGSSTYHGYIFVRKDSGIKGVRDMKGKVFVFVDKATTAGYIFPVAYLLENGVKDYKKFLKEFYFSGTHEGAIYDVLNKKADIGAAKNTIYEDLMKKDERIKNELIILRASSKVPENGLAVRKDLDRKIKEKLKIALLQMHMDEEGKEVLKKFGANRFIETKDEDYKPVYELVKKANIDIKKYLYTNK